MMPKITTGFSNASQGLQMFPVTEEYLVSPSVEVNSDSGSYSSSLLFYLSDLKDKLSQLQNLVGVLVSPEQNLPESTSMARSTMNSTIQELIDAATSMSFTCQQMTLIGSKQGTTACTNELRQQQFDHDRLPPHQLNFGNNRGVLSNMGSDIRGQSFHSTSTEVEALHWFAKSYNHNHNDNNSNCNLKNDDQCVATCEATYSMGGLSPGNETDIIELDAGDLLARYTYFCHVCGKGFKRDANLRMHMRAHGEEYKTNEALINPMKDKGSLGEGTTSMKPKKYSCPHEGCRWNQKHARFKPLKSMVCVKNHYKRNHCPKMYVCKRCNQKQYSVLSDLKTHEKHCGNPRWQCSCGTKFSRKDKLMGHVAVFVGHTPSLSVACQNNRHGSNRSVVVQDN